MSQYGNMAVSTKNILEFFGKLEWGQSAGLDAIGDE